MLVILTFFLTRDIYTRCAGVQRTPNQTGGDVTFSRSCDAGKGTKKDWKIITDV